MNNMYEIRNERGSVTSSLASGGIVTYIEHQLNDIKFTKETAHIKRVMCELAEMVMNGDIENEYAITYVKNLPQSYIMYDINGLTTQMNYVISNIKNGNKEAIDKVEKLLKYVENPESIDCPCDAIDGEKDIAVIEG